MTSESSNLEGVVVPESATPDQAEPAEQTVELSVAVAHDGTQALLTLHADPPEPYPFTLKAIVQTLNEHGVVQGILEEAIGQVVDNQEYVTDLLVAREIPPEQGEDARIDLLFDPFPKPAPAETPGQVDWREVKLIQTVIESQPIARKIPARTGTPGMTVTGKRIEPRKVRDVRLPAGRGTKVNENDPNELLAATPGAVRLANNQVVVDKVLTVPRDVDFSVGNIDFDGSVQIGGNVLPGFRVRVTGDIHITGLIEEATIEAGGSIWISQGVLGDINKSTVHASKDVAVKFARNATISAEGRITVQSEAVNCHLQSENFILVGSPEARRGRLIGGEAVAAQAVRVVDLGADIGTATIVTIPAKGLSARLQEERVVAEQAAKLRDDHARIMDEVANLLRLQATDKSTWTPSYEQLLAKLTAAANQVERELHALEDRLAELAKVEKPKVVVYGTLFPGVRITIGHRTRSFDEALKNVQIVPTDDFSGIVALGLQSAR